jgi:hypothetical protein
MLRYPPVPHRLVHHLKLRRVESGRCCRKAGGFYRF